MEELRMNLYRVSLAREDCDYSGGWRRWSEDVLARHAIEAIRKAWRIARSNGCPKSKTIYVEKLEEIANNVK
jgi:hypothetical protein